MSVPVKSNSLQTYQTILYNRALHPEFFPLKGRRVIRRSRYELELWVMAGSHLLRFEHGTMVASELVTDQEGNLPDQGVVTAFLCAGERDFEHRFDSSRVTYMTTVQTETLSENLYLATYKEMLALAKESDALAYEWQDEVGKCLSMLDMQQFNREVHVQAYHLMAMGGLVLRTQTLFEHP
jgi:hypothetical protein